MFNLLKFIYNRRKKTKYIFFIFIIVLSICAAVSTIAQRQIAAVESRGIAAIEQKLGAQADLLALIWVDALHQIDHLQHLASLVTESRQRDAAQANRVLAELQSAVAQAGPSVLQASALGLDGHVLWSTLPMPAGQVDLSQREHYRAIVQDGLRRFVGRPVIGAISARHTIQFAAADRDATGALVAVSVVSVDTAISPSMRATIADDPAAQVSVIRQDGVILTSSHPEEVGQTATPAPAGQQVWRATSPSDGVSRFYALRTIDGADMSVRLARDAATELLPITLATDNIRRIANLLTVALIVLALVAAGAISLARLTQDERRRAQRSAQAEAVLRQISASAHDVMTLHDHAMRTHYANAALHTVLGRAPDALVGSSLAALAVPADAEIIQTVIDQVMAGAGRVRQVFRAQHDDGSLRWLETEIVAVVDADHPQSRYLAVSRNVTARIERETALHALRAERESMLYLGPGTHYQIRGENGRPGAMMLSIRPDATLFGLTAAACAAPDFSLSFATDLDRQARDAALRDCLETGEARVEYRITMADGGTAVLRDEMRRAPQGAGTAILYGYLTDITREHDERQALRHLERLATFGEVVTGIAHDIAQPLAVISMAAENGLRAQLRGPSGQARAADKFVAITEQTARLKALIDNMLRLARGDEVVVEPFAFATVLALAVQMVERRAAEASVRLQVSIPQDLPPIIGGRLGLEQVLINLLINAFDAYISARIPLAERWVWLAAAAQGECVHITVQDRAGGIPPDLLPRIFDPFVTTKAAGKGTGMGLAVCLRMIQTMGGTLEVASDSSGTQFAITLPAAMPADDLPELRHVS